MNIFRILISCIVNKNILKRTKLSISLESEKIDFCSRSSFCTNALRSCSSPYPSDWAPIPMPICATPIPIPMPALAIAAMLPKQPISPLPHALTSTGADGPQAPPHPPGVLVRLFAVLELVELVGYEVTSPWWVADSHFSKRIVSRVNKACLEHREHRDLRI